MSPGHDIPSALAPLYQTLGSVLLHRASEQNLPLRSDGFAKLEEALSVDCMQSIIETLVPGCAAALNTHGYGGVVPPALSTAVREIVTRTAASKSGFHFELWDGDVNGVREVWIKAFEPDVQVLCQDDVANRLQNPQDNSNISWPAPTPAKDFSIVDDGLPSFLDQLSSTMLTLLRHSGPKEGLNIRSDGFARLDELLSVDCMQIIVEGIAPGSKGALNTHGVGGPVPQQLLEAVLYVSKSLSNGLPLFEFWDATVDTAEKIWIKATHGHTLESLKVSTKSHAKATAHSKHGPSRLDSAAGAQTRSLSRGIDYKSMQTRVASGTDGKTSHATPSSLGEAPTSNIVPSSTTATRPLTTGPTLTGRLLSYNHEKKYGFVRVPGIDHDVFLHFACIEGQCPAECTTRKGELPVGPDVELCIDYKNGKARASRARLLATSDECSNTSQRKDVCVEEKSVRKIQPALTLQDVLKLLPADAPPAVREYLRALTCSVGAP